MAKLRRLHRVTAMIIGVYIAVHLANHLLIFAGADWHIWAMDALRIVYRNPILEPLLLMAFAVQVALGLRLLWHRGWPSQLWPRLQVTSGGILGLFLIQHIGATLMTRVSYDQIDTNAYWAAAVVSRAPFVWYFAPYYALGVAALFAHIAFALHRRPAQRWLAWPTVAIGLITGSGFVLGLMAVTVPPAYEAYLGDYWF